MEAVFLSEVSVVRTQEKKAFNGNSMRKGHLEEISEEKCAIGGTSDAMKVSKSLIQRCA